MPGSDTPPAEYAAYRRVVHDSFENWYRAGKDSWTGAFTSERVTDFVSAAAPRPEAPDVPRRALDIGCGRGHQTAALAERLHADVVGIDLLDVWDAPEPARGSARFAAEDFLDVRCEPLDLLVDNGCLHHQRRAEWAGWVAHGRRLLRPGGVWVASCFLNPASGVADNPLADGRLNWWFDEEVFTGLFTRAGFEPTGRLVIDRRFQYRGLWLQYLVVSFLLPQPTGGA